jgi:hypothetical protein
MANIPMYDDRWLAGSIAMNTVVFFPNVGYDIVGRSEAAVVVVVAAEDAAEEAQPRVDRGNHVVTKTCRSNDNNTPRGDKYNVHMLAVCSRTRIGNSVFS